MARDCEFPGRGRAPSLESSYVLARLPLAMITLDPLDGEDGIYRFNLHRIAQRLGQRGAAGSAPARTRVARA